jgi:putative ABC transport system permease protein
MKSLVSWGEVRLGLRLIAKQPILSATIVLALATGICVVTIGFTFRDELVSSALPYANGDRFARVFGLDRDGGRVAIDLQRYHAVRDRATSFEHVGAGVGRPFTVTHENGELESIRGAILTPRSMAHVEAVPMLGRTLIAADGGSGAEAVVVIRESLWRRRYAADPALIGRHILVGAEPRTVVGVMPDSFEFPNRGEIWVPTDELTLAGVANTPGQRVYGVLRPGVSFESASAEVSQVTSHVPAGTEPGEITRVIVKPFTADSDNSDIVASAMVVVLVMLLLVVAANVSTLVFARTWARAPELAVRTALGAARTRVVAQLFLEMLLLGAVATLLGVSAAFGVFQYIKGAAGDDIPFWIDFAPTARTILFAVFLMLLVSVVSGLLPALRVTRHDLRNTLHTGRGFAAGGFGRVGAALLIVEIALSVGLLNGAVTMARAFNAYFDEIPALPKNQVLTAHLGRVRSPEMRDKIVEAAAAIPGVQAAGAGQLLPRLYPMPRPTAVEPIGDEPRQAAMPAPSHAVGHGFLEAVGGRALSGRLLAATDFVEGAAPVAVVNEPFVRRFLGGRNPIGRRIRIEQLREDGSTEPWREIVGVVPDLGLSVANPSLAAGFYMPVRDEMLTYLAVRTTGPPLELGAPLRAAVANVHPDLQIEEIDTLDNAAMEERAFLSGISLGLTAMGGMALLLSIVGIYALLSFMVTRRTREIGVRVALGATSRQVLRSVTGGALVYLAIGGALGSVLGVLFVEARQVMIISIPDAGVWMPATIFAVLAIAGGGACWLPARRALGIRPSEALSAD